jgi:hypothetical protein
VALFDGTLPARPAEPLTTEEFASAIVGAYKTGQADAIEKANPSLAGTPMAGSSVPTAVVNVPVVTPTPPGSRTVGDQVGFFYRSLPRVDEIFNAPLGPSDPMLPAPIDVVDPITGRAIPRKQQAQVGENLNLTSRQTPWSVLRQLATQCDIIARCIQIRIGELVKMDLTFAVSKRAIEDIMDKEKCSHAKAARLGRLQFADEIQRLTDFWENPYPQSDRSFSEWVTEFGNQHFRYDGVPVYPRYNLKKQVIGFDIIDSPTIKCLLDNRGDIPKPPFPAYQQILWGYPRGEMQASPVADGEFYEGIKDMPGDYIKDQLSYFVQNRSTDTLYGFSAVEMSIPWASIYLERQKWMLDQFRLGTTPKTFIKTPIDADIDPFKLAQWERMFNDQLRGQNRERNNAKLLPGGFDPVRMAQEAELYKTDMDEFLIKRLAAPFGVTPTALNVTPKSGLGGKNMSDGEAQTAEAVSSAPDLDFFQDVINTLNRRYLDGTVNVTCIISDQDSTKDELEAAQAGQTSTQSAQMTLNELRDEQGRTPYEDPEADSPFVVIPGVGLQFLKGMLAQNEAGETTGQKGEPSEQEGDDDSPVPGGGPQGHGDGGNDDPEGEGGAGDPEGGPTPGSSGGGGKATKAGLVELELVKFDRYATARKKQATWRDFKFEHVDAAIAARLNKMASSEMRGAPVSDDPKGSGRSLTKAPRNVHAAMQQQVEDHYAPLISAAIASMYTGVDRAITEAMQHPDRRKLQIGMLKKDAEDDLAANKKLAQTAINQHVSADPSTLQDALTNLYGDSSIVGTRTGQALMGQSAYVATGVAQLVAGYDDDFWEHWTPGDPTAALKVAGGGMRSLLDHAGITIKGIDATTQDRMADAIAQAMMTGTGDAGAREAIVALLGQAGAPQEGLAAATRAATISVTETTRGCNAAATDQYQAAGATGWNWDDYAEACDECEDEASNNPHDFGDDVPPLHPNCRCLAMPVTG